MSLPTGLLPALPWILFALLAHLALRHRPSIRQFQPPAPEASPLVSIIVPARDEALNISACVASLINSVYPSREVIIVDDGSVDGTGEIARILAARSDLVTLVVGEPLPQGWLGKSWACWQGYRHARGDVLLFTDADTRHDDALLGHAVGALQATGAALVSVLPRQLMETFWERTVLPQIFTLLSLRYRDLERLNDSPRPRDAIANGQFLMVTREAYEAVGGHEGLRAEVVEDQRLAQGMVAAGRKIFLAHAEDLMDTRMYRSLRGIVEGWTKNLAAGARHSVDRWLRPALPWLAAAVILGFWVVPPLVLVMGVVGRAGPILQSWALLATLSSLLFWLVMHARLRIPLLHAFVYPLGALVAALLFVRSAVRGSSIQWKGRRYRVDSSRAP